MKEPKQLRKLSDEELKQVTGGTSENGDRQHLDIGTIGHFDRGKITLTADITKVMKDLNAGDD